MTPYQNIPTLQQRNFSLFLGAIAGFLGTIPMTIFMLAMHRFLPKWQRYALPPQKITEELADRADLENCTTLSAGASLSLLCSKGRFSVLLFGLRVISVCFLR